MRAFMTSAVAAVALIVSTLPGDAHALETPDHEFEALSALRFGEPDREGLRRDTWYFLGYQWVTIGLLYVAPESVSGWTDEQKEGYDMSYWWDNVTNPQWDTDDWYLNYILHPYFGAAYYIRAHERGYNDSQSFWYSAMLSCMYEFGAEALFEEVSIQDVFVTPIGGHLVAQLFVRARDDIRAREAELGYRTRRDKWVWVLTDPLGSLNQQVDRLFGRGVSAQIRPFRHRPRRRAPTPMDMPIGDTPIGDSDPVYGLELYIEF